MLNKPISALRELTFLLIVFFLKRHVLTKRQNKRQGCGVFGYHLSPIHHFKRSYVSWKAASTGIGTEMGTVYRIRET